MLPPLRKLHSECNEYARQVAVLKRDLATLQSERCTLADTVANYSDEFELIKAELIRFRTEQFFSNEDIRRDLYALIYRGNMIPTAAYAIETSHHVAADSNDHIFPRGAKNDNTRYPRFVAAIEAVLGQKLRVLDLGCSGGGMVLDFLLSGHNAVGIEGSDYSQRWQRAEWANIGDRLFTADITKPFTLHTI